MNRLACIFGRHRRTIHDDDGEAYEVCSRCGKRLRYRPPKHGFGDTGGGYGGLGGGGT